MIVNSYNKFFAEVATIMGTEVKSVKPIDGRYKVELANRVYLHVYRGVSGSLFVHDHRVSHITSCYDFEDFKTLKDLYERLITDYSESTNAETVAQTSEESIKDTIMTVDCIKTVLNMEELFSQMWGDTIRTKCKMYNNSCYGCPADREGNRCGGKQWCKQTWKRYGAIVNPNWHHVSLPTLANIDNDMLDEKRRHYMKVYRMTANAINSIYKCTKLTSIDKLRTNLIQTVRTMAKNEKIEWALVQYVKAKIDNCYLVNGLQSSFYSTTYGCNKSRSYTKTFFI